MPSGRARLICVLLDLAWLLSLPRTVEAERLPMLESRSPAPQRPNDFPCSRYGGGGGSESSSSIDHGRRRDRGGRPNLRTMNLTRLHRSPRAAKVRERRQLGGGGGGGGDDGEMRERRDHALQQRRRRAGRGARRHCSAAAAERERKRRERESRRDETRHCARGLGTWGTPLRGGFFANSQGNFYKTARLSNLVFFASK